MTDFIHKVSALSPEKRQLLFHRLRQAGHQVNVFPLSFAQRRLWFLHQLDPDSPTYNMPVAVRMRGPLQYDAIEQSLNTMVERHAVLRTRLLPAGEEPLQVIVPDQQIALVVENLTASSPAQREAQAQSYLAAEARRPFDVANEPLLRVHLLRLTEEDHILLVIIHHCIADGASIVAFLEELKAAYQAFAAGQTCSLPELPIQYTDFTVWQHEQLQPQRLEPALAYWQQQLPPPLPVLELPSDYPRPTVRGSQGATYTFKLSPQLREDLEQFSSYTGVTLFMTLLAAFQVVLFRYTGQTDLIVGSPISDRSRPETRRLIGLFINTLVLRTDLSGNPTFRELLYRVRKTCLGAYAHQQLPFDKLVEAVHPERTLSHTPLFQTMFVFQEIPEQMLDFQDLSLSLVPIDSGTAQFDVSLYLMTGTTPGLSGKLEYRTDLFEADTMARMAGHFQTVLESILTNPEQRLSALPLLTQHEQQQLLAWNATQTDYPHDQQLHDLFEAQVQATPDAIAVCCEETHWTYQELNRRANQLAHYLRRYGVGPEVLVAICVERSLEMLVGLLGILKAGGAYVPLDPSYPQDRLAYMVQDSGVAVLLTQHKWIDQLRSLDLKRRPSLVSLDTDWPLIAREKTDQLSSRVTPHNVAYMIYTSGSTGQPKGVLNEHRGICNRLLWMQDAYRLNQDDRVLQKTPYSFDVSVWEFFWPLISGASLVVARPGGHQDSAYLVRLIQEQSITTLHFVPPMLQAFLEEGGVEQCASLKRVICSGEALPFDLQERFFQRLSSELHNLYGPTEAAIDVTFWHCQPNSPLHLVPIGKPIANTQIYILDQHLHPVPVGVPGELHIGGTGVARGYRNRSELTAEKFIPNLLSDRSNARLYKTGDRARSLPDGNIEFLGRLDHQVKIRGFRIELGEIEAVLGAHPLIQESVVIVREDVPGNPRLVAYIVAKQTAAPPSVTELRHFLAEKLPDYMLPAHMVFLDALPLTPNGKTNRQALPAPDQLRPDLEQTYVAPQTPDEKAVAQIWQQVLGIEQIGIHDNFFELGGHSLQTVQIVSKISAVFDQQLPVKWLFLYPTIASLAAALRTQKAHENDHARQNGAPQNDSAKRPSAQATPATQVTIEHRSLLSLFATGQLAPVQAAAIASLPDTLLDYTGLSADDILHNWCQDMPLFQGVYEMALGRIALLLIPQFSSQLYHDQPALLDRLIEALTMAKTLGAQTVSLTGLLPSATDYGRAVAERIGDRQGHELPRLTTGHATTAATVVLSVRRIVAEAGRGMPQERVGVLGLGSIGIATLRLMLSSLPHPEQLILCDVYEKRSHLETLRQELINDLHFSGPVHIVDAQATVPPAFYNATLIIGASNVPDILDIHQIQPGTLIVDDSAPHCLSAVAAMRRFQDRADLLFTEGGVLRAPAQIRRQFYLPHQDASRIDLSAFTQVDPYEITGCIFSSLLSARFAHLPPTVGLADNATSRRHYEQLEQLDFQAAQLHYEGHVLETRAIERFRQRFGHSLAPAPLYFLEEYVV